MSITNYICIYVNLNRIKTGNFKKGKNCEIKSDDVFGGQPLTQRKQIRLKTIYRKQTCI